MAAKKNSTATVKEVVSVCWTGKKFVAMPEDLDKHAGMSVAQIEKQPEVVWDEETQTWGLK